MLLPFILRKFLEKKPSWQVRFEAATADERLALLQNELRVENPLVFFNLPIDFLDELAIKAATSSALEASKAHLRDLVSWSLDPDREPKTLPVRDDYCGLIHFWLKSDDLAFATHISGHTENALSAIAALKRVVAADILCLIEIENRRAKGLATLTWHRWFGPFGTESWSREELQQRVASLLSLRDHECQHDVIRGLLDDMFGFISRRASTSWLPIENILSTRPNVATDSPSGMRLSPATWFLQAGRNENADIWKVTPAFVFQTAALSSPFPQNGETRTLLDRFSREIWERREDLKVFDIKTEDGVRKFITWILTEGINEGILLPPKVLVDHVAFEESVGSAWIGPGEDAAEAIARSDRHNWRNLSLAPQLKYLSTLRQHHLSGQEPTIAKLFQIVRSLPKDHSSGSSPPYLLTRFLQMHAISRRLGPGNSEDSKFNFLIDYVRQTNPLVFYNMPFDFLSNIERATSGASPEHRLESLVIRSRGGNETFRLPDLQDYRWGLTQASGDSKCAIHRIYDRVVGSPTASLPDEFIWAIGLDMLCLFEIEWSRQENEFQPLLWHRCFGPLASRDPDRNALHANFNRLFEDTQTPLDLRTQLMTAVETFLQRRMAPNYDPVETLKKFRQDTIAAPDQSVGSDGFFESWFLLQGWIEYPRVLQDTPAYALQGFGQTARLPSKSHSGFSLTELMKQIWMRRADLQGFDLATAEGSDRFLVWLFTEGFRDGFLFAPSQLVDLLSFDETKGASPIGHAVLARGPFAPPTFELEFWLNNYPSVVGFHLRLLETYRSLLMQGREPTIGDLADRRVDSPFCERAPLTEGVTVIGYARNELGIGEDARTTYHSLRSHCPEGTVSLFSVQPPGHPKPSPNIDLTGHLSDHVSSKINLFCLPLVDYTTLRLDFGTRLTDGRYNIALAPWEFADWSPKLDFCFAGLQEVWAPSKFVVKAYEGKGVAVRHMPLAVTLGPVANLSRTQLGLPENTYLFGFMFDFNSLVTRKNPLALVKAFQEAFPGRQDVALVIKTMYKNANSTYGKIFSSIVDSDPRIHVLDRVMPREELLGFLNVCDAYVSLHRSEGFGRTLAEAMLLKKPVISTRFSGTMDFADDESALTVDINLKMVAPGEYPMAAGFSWAEPDVNHAAQRLKEAYRGGPGVETMVKRAYERIVDGYSIESTARLYGARIHEILTTLE